jgi:hypothetical protein
MDQLSSTIESFLVEQALCHVPPESMVRDGLTMWNLAVRLAEEGGEEVNLENADEIARAWRLRAERTTYEFLTDRYRRQVDDLTKRHAHVYRVASWLLLAVAAAALVGYKVGHGPVHGLTERVGVLETSAQEQSKDLVVKLDALRAVGLNLVAVVEGNSEVIAGNGAGAAYATGVFDECWELLGRESLVCDRLNDVFNGQGRYPNDPGYIPPSVGQDLGQISKHFEGVKGFFCENDLWPYTPVDTFVKETCDEYGATVGQVLLGE